MLLENKETFQETIVSLLVSFYKIIKIIVLKEDKLKKPEQTKSLTITNVYGYYQTEQTMMYCQI